MKTLSKEGSHFKQSSDKDKVIPKGLTPFGITFYIKTIILNALLTIFTIT